MKKQNKPHIQPYSVISLQADKHLIYFPFKKTIIETNEQGLQDIERYFKSYGESVETRFLQTLKQKGLLDLNNAIKSSQQSSINFAPTSVTLFPTMDCNLRCVYCYSSGGKHNIYMDSELAKASVNQIFANAIILQTKSVGITFHGGGEPTLNWKLITEITGYAKALGKALQINVSVSCGTNGNIPKKHIEWLLSNLDFVCLSMDGLSDIHDYQRPRANGKGSFAGAFKTLRMCENEGFNYQIRATVTRKSLPYLIEFLEFLKVNAPNCMQLQLEPLFPVGRALTTGEEPPSASDFMKIMRMMKQRSKELNYPIVFAACDISSTRYNFCGAYGENFVVTPTGHVTTCYEVSTPDDPRWKYFHIGYYDKKLRQFQWNLNTLNLLGRLSVKHRKKCHNCIACFHCAGGCPAKRLFTENPKLRDEQCSVVTTLVKDQILENAELLMNKS